jgi:hypothetical protein
MAAAGGILRGMWRLPTHTNPGKGAYLRPGYRAHSADVPRWRKSMGRSVTLSEGDVVLIRMDSASVQYQFTKAVTVFRARGEQSSDFEKAQNSSVGKVASLWTERTSNRVLVLWKGKTLFSSLTHRDRLEPTQFPIHLLSSGSSSDTTADIEWY